MDKLEAKRVLALYRPNTSDAEDPLVAEALMLARRDPELTRWLADHLATQSVIREHLQQIVAPTDLRERILSNRELESRRRSSTKIIFFRQPAFLAAAAMIALMIGVAAFYFWPREAKDFAAFRDRMARTVMRNYGMQMLDKDLTKIRDYLAQHNGLADYTLPANLQKLPGAGCAVLHWRGNTVSMICFSLNPKQDLYLFVIDSKKLPDPPKLDQPEFQQISKLATTCWSHEDKSYMLAVVGDRNALDKLP